MSAGFSPIERAIYAAELRRIAARLREAGCAEEAQEYEREAENALRAAAAYERQLVTKKEG